MSTRLDEKRINRTLLFLSKHISPNSKVLDLGTTNKLSQRIAAMGHSVINTKGENLDVDYENYINKDVDVVTSFEIFEHMLAPFNILRNLKTDKLITSVPLKLWFSSAYWNEEDDWDKHYHEFEVKQFEFLLQKTGWKIIDSEKWTSGNWSKIGIRPILRNFTPRYYIAYCERIKI
jgi:hypothetical protein